MIKMVDWAISFLMRVGRVKVDLRLGLVVMAGLGTVGLVRAGLDLGDLAGLSRLMRRG